MKKLLFLTVIVLFASCGKHPKALEHEVAPAVVTPVVTIDSIVAEFKYPANNQLTYNNELIADLSQDTEVVSTAGSVKKGRTLNYITIQGIQFLVYGEDGVFATECETSADHPEYGSTNPRCEVAHAESFDQIILCTSATANVDLATAQEWPGSALAESEADLGMVCWVNGQKMISNKIFTY